MAGTWRNGASFCKSHPSPRLHNNLDFKNHPGESKWLTNYVNFDSYERTIACNASSRAMDELSASHQQQQQQQEQHQQQQQVEALVESIVASKSRSPILTQSVNESMLQAHTLFEPNQTKSTGCKSCFDSLLGASFIHENRQQQQIYANQITINRSLRNHLERFSSNRIEFKGLHAKKNEKDVVNRSDRSRSMTDMMKHSQSVSLNDRLAKLLINIKNNKTKPSDSDEPDNLHNSSTKLALPATIKTLSHCQYLSTVSIVYLSSTCLVLSLLIFGTFFKSLELNSPIIMANALNYRPKSEGLISFHPGQQQQHIRQRQNQKLLTSRSVVAHHQHPSKLPLAQQDDAQYNKNYLTTTTSTTRPTSKLVHNIQQEERRLTKNKSTFMTPNNNSNRSKGKSSLEPKSSLYYNYKTVIDRYRQAIGYQQVNSTTKQEQQQQQQQQANAGSNEQKLIAEYKTLADQYPKFSLFDTTTAPVTAPPRIHIVRQLGSSCHYSRDCRKNIENSHCNGDNFTCTCLPHHVPLNSMVCLPPVLISYPCQIDSQCTEKVPNSHCLEGTCQCQMNFVAHRKDKCLPPALINDYCLKDDQCRLNDQYSYCKWIIPHIYGKCKCPRNYLVHGSHCSPRLGDECKLDEDCQVATMNSYCQRPTHRASRSQLMLSRCACKPDYEMSSNMMQCASRLTNTTMMVPTSANTTKIINIDNVDPQVDTTTTMTTLPTPLPAPQTKTTTPTLTTTTTTTTTTTSSPITTSNYATGASKSPHPVTQTMTTPEQNDQSMIVMSSPEKIDNIDNKHNDSGQQMNTTEKEKNKYELIFTTTFSSYDNNNNNINNFNGSITPTTIMNMQSVTQEANAVVNMSRPIVEPTAADDFIIESNIISTSTTVASSLSSSRAPEATTMTSLPTNLSTTIGKLAPLIRPNVTTGELQDIIATTEISISGKYKATSLGKRCEHKKECQLRDPYSDCIDGVCECQRPTSQCSAKSTGCFKETFQCRNGQCISWYFVCDKFRNCDDGSDENECIPNMCPKEAFQCDDGTCITRSKVCNGHWECPDGSDEARCYKGVSCDPKAFRCQNGQCLPQYVFCNAVEDCMDGSDEMEQTCENNNMSQISTAVVSASTRQRKYHKKLQMGRSLDRGSNDNTLYTNTSLSSSANGITSSSASLKCPESSFTCTNGKCRSTAILCSGVDGCGDGSDEDRCEICSCEPPNAPFSSLVGWPQSRRSSL